MYPSIFGAYVNKRAEISSLRTEHADRQSARRKTNHMRRHFDFITFVDLVVHEIVRDTCPFPVIGSEQTEAKMK